MICPKCGGSGEINDPRKTGEQMKSFRLKAGVSLRKTALLMRFTPAYISDLEHGRRGWRDGLISKYKAAVEDIQNSIS